MLPGHPCQHLSSSCLVRKKLLQPRLVNSGEGHCQDDPYMQLLLGPNDFHTPHQSPSLVIAFAGPSQPFPPLPLKNWGYSPSKAWKRSLCSTVRRGGAHRNSGGASSRRADLGAGEMQVREDWDKEETERPRHSLTSPFPSLCLFTPNSTARFREKVPQGQAPQATPRPLLKDFLSFTSLSLRHASLLSL